MFIYRKNRRKKRTRAEQTINTEKKSVFLFCEQKRRKVFSWVARPMLPWLAEYVVNGHENLLGRVVSGFFRAKICKR
jgi:hypothetical protein